MNNILITGGTGFFGKSILSLVKNGFLSDYNFIILSRDPEKFLSNYTEFKDISNVNYIKGNILDFKYDNYNIDYIIHAATTVAEKISNDETEKTIINGTEQILKYAEKCNKLKNLLFISSGGVYGNNKSDINISESNIPDPFTIYGKSKLKAEEMCLNTKLPITIGRVFALIGKYLSRNSSYAIGNFIKNCLQNEPITINGDGTSVRSYLYSDDLIEWLFTLLLKNNKNDIFNIGSDVSISIKDLANLIKNTLNSNSEIIIKNIMKEKTSNYYVPNVSKIINKFNLKITADLKNSILKSI